MAALARLIDKARAAGDRFFVPENAAEFGPGVTDPEKIICIGLNYRKHAAETGNPVPPVPILFNKFNSALNHHGGTIAVSKEPAEKFDYEAELVIVIGREARNVSEEDAPNYIFGYATGNDFTARDLQSRTSQWMIGKSGDGWAPLGPWLSPPTRSTATTSRSSSRSTARRGNPPTPRTWCSAARSSSATSRNT